MEYTITASVIIVAAYIIYLNILATIVVKYSHELTRFQRTSQFIVVWLLPILGAGLVLHFLFRIQPDTLPKSWIPWPFKKMIYGPPITPNKNRDDRERTYGSGKWR